MPDSGANAQVEQLRRLTDIGRALTYTTSLDQVARLTVERGASLLDAVAAVLMLPDADGLMHVRAAHGITEDRVTRFREPLTDDMTERLQGLLDVPDVRFLAVPLIVGGSVTGLVAVALTQAATDSDEWLLSALADQAAVALESARLGGEVRLEMENRLRVSEGATSAKDRALATLAHDIRSPLGAIDGYCSNLEDDLYGPLNERQRQALVRVRMSGRHLLSLLDSVMDMARLTVGAKALPLAEVSLDDVVRESMDMLRPAAQARSQVLTREPGPTLVVTGNAPRLRQVLVNLIGNAVKFTPQGGTITVSVHESARDGTPAAEVHVSDTGPGIAEAERLAIFEPYYRSEDTAQVSGIGLGLAISHAIVQQMGGTLEVESAPGAGSTFILTLRAAA